MRTLRPCTSCARHVLVEERVCPFCDALLALDRAPHAQPMRRLARAAQAAFAASVIAGCHEEVRKPDDAVKITVDSSIAADSSAAADAADAKPGMGNVDVDEQQAAFVDATTEAAPPDAATHVVDAAPTKKWVKPPPHGVNKPYGAPPADGLLV